MHTFPPKIAKPRGSNISPDASKATEIEEAIQVSGIIKLFNICPEQEGSLDVVSL